jgi:hypothetical protein
LSGRVRASRTGAADSSGASRPGLTGVCPAGLILLFFRESRNAALEGQWAAPPVLTGRLLFLIRHGGGGAGCLIVSLIDPRLLGLMDAWRPPDRRMIQ